MTSLGARTEKDGNRVAPSQMSEEERSDIVLTTARILHENGEETSGTLEATQQLCRHFELDAELVPSWGELLLREKEGHVRVAAATPTNVNMSRVVATLQAVENICAGRLPGGQAKEALEAAGHAPASSLPLFVLACTAGAGALTLINGASHFRVVAVVMASAGLGALLRRGLAGRSFGSFFQMFAATLLAGGVGALAIRCHLSSPLRLAALGPLLVLVPGPALLGGAFDVAAYRLPLGGARLGFGLLTILTMSAGVIIGLSLGGEALPAALPTHTLPFWLDVLCAGIAAASYGVFFSMPLRMIVYPVAVGMLAHAVRWGVIGLLNGSTAAGAGAACLVAGIIMVPIARRLRLPFAAVGFASVVSMVPGSILVRMAGGLVQIEKQTGAASVASIAGVLADGTTTAAVLLAMALGLLLPLRVYRYARERKSKAKAEHAGSVLE